MTTGTHGEPGGGDETFTSQVVTTCGWLETGLREIVVLDPPSSEMVKVAAGGMGGMGLDVRIPNGICTVTAASGVHCAGARIPPQELSRDTANNGTVSGVSGGWLSSFNITEMPASLAGSGKPLALTFVVRVAPIPDTKKVKIWPGATLTGMGGE